MICYCHGTVFLKTCRIRQNWLLKHTLSMNSSVSTLIFKTGLVPLKPQVVLQTRMVPLADSVDAPLISSWSLQFLAMFVLLPAATTCVLLPLGFSGWQSLLCSWTRHVASVRSLLPSLRSIPQMTDRTQIRK